VEFSLADAKMSPTSSQELVPYKVDGEAFKNTRGVPLALRYRAAAAAAGDLAAAAGGGEESGAGSRVAENESSIFLSSIIKDESAAERDGFIERVIDATLGVPVAWRARSRREKRRIERRPVSSTRPALFGSPRSAGAAPI